MRSFAPLALFAFAAGVTATDPKCEANYILEACIANQQLTYSECGVQDWDCLCPYYQNIRGCYNNCPNDPDIDSADGNVLIFCQNASLYGSKTLATTATRATSTGTTTTPTGSDSDSDSGSNGPTPTNSSNNSEETGFTNDNNNDAGSNAAALVRNTGAVLAGIAGAVALLL
jgi:hypothetical protein